MGTTTSRSGAALRVTVTVSVSPSSTGYVAEPKLTVLSLTRVCEGKTLHGGVAGHFPHSKASAANGVTNLFQTLRQGRRERRRLYAIGPLLVSERRDESGGWLHGKSVARKAGHKKRTSHMGGRPETQKGRTHVRAGGGHHDSVSSPCVLRSSVLRRPALRFGP